MSSWPSREPQPAARPAWVMPTGLAAMAALYLAAFRYQLLPLWPAMAAVAALSWWVAWHPSLAARLRPTPRLVGIGLASAVALYLVVAAGALLASLTPLWPAAERVAELVRADAPAPLAALLIVLVTSPGEEVLWRGAVYDRLARRLGPGWGPVAASTLLYALFVSLSGNPVLPLAAGACGAVWARQRQVTGSIVPGLVSHAAWALAVYLFLPGLPRA
jgi:membrane protease YdiL (CAAX protease family)